MCSEPRPSQSSSDRERTALQETGQVAVAMSLAEAVRIADDLALDPLKVLIVGTIRVLERP